MGPGVRLSRPTVISQYRINPQGGRGHSQHIGGLLNRKRCTGAIPDQVVAQRSETSCDVGIGVSFVPSDDAITYTHLARYGFPVDVLAVLNRETSSIVTGFITIDGTKLNINLAAKIGEAATLTRGRIIRDGTVSEGDPAVGAIGDAATVAALSRDCIARDGAVGDSERAVGVSDDAAAFYEGSSRSHIARDGAVGDGEHTFIGDAATPSRGRITRDGAVAQRERTLIEDASRAVGASACVARDGAVTQCERALIEDASRAVGASACVARDGAVAQRKRASIEDASRAVGASACVARDGAVAQRERALIVDDAVGSFALLEGQTGKSN